MTAAEIHEMICNLNKSSDQMFMELAYQQAKKLKLGVDYVIIENREHEKLLPTRV